MSPTASAHSAAVAVSSTSTTVASASPAEPSGTARAPGNSTSAPPSQPAARRTGGDERLADQRTPEALHDPGEFVGAHRGAAVLLVEGESEPAQLGVLAPHVAAPAFVGLDTLQPGVGVVALLEQPVDA